MTRASLLGFTWLRPDEWVWVLAALVLLLLGGWAVRQRARALEQLVAPRQRPRFVPRLSLNRAHARFVLASAALAFLALALAGPVRGYTLREVRRRGLDLVVCIDTSRSMLVRDLRPDRITRARREVLGLLDRLRGDRLALIAFAGDAREIAPLTHDRTALAGLLERVSPAENEKGGTDLGAALERALAMFDGRTGAHEAIVLLTDGEDLEGHGLELARKAAERNVKVFVVGMGTEAGGKIPIARAGGGESFLRDQADQEVVSAMGGRGLEELARSTGGAYLSAEASAAPLEELYDKRISRLEARELVGGQEFVPHDRFQWFLVLAGGSMLAAAGLRERRARAARRPLSRTNTAGRGVEKPAWARALAPLFLLPAWQVTPDGPLPGEPAPAAAPRVAPYEGGARDGLIALQKALATEEHEQAAQLYAALLAKPGLADGARAEIEFHGGVLLERAGDLAAASAAFARAGGLAEPGSLRLDAWYDAGTVDLQAAELLYLEIPEVRDSRGLPPLEPPAAAPGAPPAEEHADLDRARAAYGVSKQGLVLRLRAESGDADTRANLELIQRRLRGLEKLRKEREEKKKEEAKKEKDPNQKPDPNQKGEDPKKSDPSDEKPEPSEDGKDPEQKPEEEPEPDESKPAEEPKPAEEDPAKEPETEAGKDPAKEPPKPAEPAQEQALSREEISRLLDQLQAIEAEARELQARIRARRRAPVEKDW